MSLATAACEVFVFMCSITLLGIFVPVSVGLVRARLFRKRMAQIMHEESPQ